MGNYPGGDRRPGRSFDSRWSRKPQVSPGSKKNPSDLTYCEGLEFESAAGAQRSPAPSPSDDREWNAVIRDFLSAAGLTQAVRGFDADMVIMNPGFELEAVPGALDDLLDSLVVSKVCRLAAPPRHIALSRSRTGSGWGNSHNAHHRGGPSINANWSTSAYAPDLSLKRKGAPRRCIRIHNEHH